MLPLTKRLGRRRLRAAALLVLHAVAPTSGLLAAVHDYGRSGDDPATLHVDESVTVDANQPLASNRYARSTRYRVVVGGTEVSAFKYQKGSTESGFYCFDVARFSSSVRGPRVEVTLKDGTEIESVELHPTPLYEPTSVTLREDRKSFAFTLSESLPYCIVAINGSAAGEQRTTEPMLAIVNDPPEADAPSRDAANVLDFRLFAQNHLGANPITDRVGGLCRPAGRVTDTSRNTQEVFTWRHGEGRFVAPNAERVSFPDKRARSPHDLSDAFQAALERVRNSDELDTIYFPAGTYLWSGLTIRGWDGAGADGPLTIYLHEDALLVNRLQECREAIEPAIGIWDSSCVAIRGRGMIDGNGCHNVALDGKPARETPHQGGAMIVRSRDIAFHDTYLRDAKQWNWECHTVENLTLNNVKGFSPFAHAWVDGLDLTSGRNVTVNGAFTLGNDDTFASGHYNPSDEFPRRFLDELDRAEGQARADLERRKERVCAAAAVYNRDRLQWDTADSENIVVRDALGWSGLANGVRLGHNTRWKGPAVDRESYRLASYAFDNFHSVLRRGGHAIRVQNGSFGSFPRYESLSFRGCSFAGNAGANVAIPVGKQFDSHRPERVSIDNCRFSNPRGVIALRELKRLTLSDLLVDGSPLPFADTVPVTIEDVEDLTVSAKGERVDLETSR